MSNKKEQEAKAEISIQELRKEGVLREKSAQLFELGMWLKAIESYFDLEGKALFRSEKYNISYRNFVEEMQIIDHVLLRITRLSVNIIGNDEWNLIKFYEYVDNILLKREKPRVISKNVDSGYHQSIQELFDRLANIRLMIKDFIMNSRISYDAYCSVGKIIDHEISSFPFLRELKGFEFNQVLDKVENSKIARIVKQIDDKIVRKQQARVFLELFRLLNYLRYIDPGEEDIRQVKMSLPLFAQFYAEMQLLFDYMNESIKTMSSHLISYAEVLNKFILSSKGELKKVYNHELLDIVNKKNEIEVRKKVLDSSRILQNQVEKSIVRFGQFFDRSMKGSDIFEHFLTRREETLKLRRILLEIMKNLDSFMVDKDKLSFKMFSRQMREFKDNYIKYLRYEDWEEFDNYIKRFTNAKNQAELLKTSDEFNRYLTKLFQQIGQRSVLSDDYLTV